MTIIVANRDCVAADSKVSEGEICYHTDKIFVIDQHIVGVAGGVEETNQFLEWFRAGRPGGAESFGKKANFRALALSREGLFYYSGRTLPDKLHNDHYAIGAGCDAAMAALFLGLDPAGAAGVACSIIASCGGPVKTLHLKDLPPSAGRTKKRV